MSIRFVPDAEEGTSDGGFEREIASIRGQTPIHVRGRETSIPTSMRRNESKPLVEA